MTRAQQHALWALESSWPMPMTLEGIQDDLRRNTNLPDAEIDALSLDNVWQIGRHKRFDLDVYQIVRL